MTMRKSMLVGVALACGLGMVLVFGLMTEVVMADESDFLSWEVHWAEENIPWSGNWTNVSGSANPDTKIYVSKIGSWMSTSYTLTLSSEPITATYSADNHFSTPSTFFLSWKQGEDAWFGTNWYQSVCVPGPEIGLRLEEAGDYM